MIGSLPSFHVGGAVRFDLQEVAKWLRTKYGPVCGEGKKPPVQVSARARAARRLTRWILERLR
jgi:hypothetical protein